MKMELVQGRRPTRAEYKGRGDVSGGIVALSAGFDLAPFGDCTLVAWYGETQVFGKLAALGGGLLEPLGKKQVKKLIDGLQSALT